jgi:prefoldin subunit 5
MSAPDNLARKLAAYKHWCETLAGTIRDYQDWVEKNNLANGTEDLRIYELMEMLKSDKLTVALVAEFSRGKTELINAIFFADTKQRLLPSEPGRTTMCPTELQYDAALPPSIRLLPIETRSSNLTINQHKLEKNHWTTLTLDLDSPKQMGETLRELMKVKRVQLDEARRLGLWQPEAGVPPPSDGLIEIPVWRHAVINYPHPLLKQGLVILDTPGLNALGTEPELTMGMLPKAQAVLFLLAADTGVTKSDLEVWQNHVRHARGAALNGCIAVLNKIDTLWDELRDERAVHDSIARQAGDTAKTLGIDPGLVFPVSAQKGLIGKIKADHALLEKSGLLELEIKLGEDLIPARQRYLRERVAQEIGAIVDSTQASVEARLTATESEIGDLKQLGGKNLDMIQVMMQRLRNEKAAYDKKLESFQSTRAVLNEQIRQLLDTLSIAAFDALINKTRQDMKESWTTHGLQVGMASFFKGAVETMERVNKHSHQFKGLIEAAYQKFHAEHGLPKLKPQPFSLITFRSRLQKLHDEAEAFRRSPVMVMTEEHFVISKFFITLVSRAREIFAECQHDAELWSKGILSPIIEQLREHKDMLEKRLDNLKKVQANLDNLGSRIAELETSRQQLHAQQAAVKQMLARIQEPLPLNE